MESSLKTHGLIGHRIMDYDAFYVPNFITDEEEEYLIRKILDSPQPQWKNLANRRWRSFQRNSSIYMTDTQFHLLMDSLQIWGGEITAKGTLLAQPLPSFIEKYPNIISRVKETGAFDHSPHQEPNHVIMNEVMCLIIVGPALTEPQYLPGQGIMPHEDGPKYHPVVATISLGSHAVFHYYRYNTESDDASTVSTGQGKSINMKPVLSVLLEPRSLIISSGNMYTSHLHGIDGVEEDLIVTDTTGQEGIKIANAIQIQTLELREALEYGTPLKRGVRYSLTCRDVARVSSLNTSAR